MSAVIVCPKCGGATESVALRVGAQAGAKAAFFGVLAVGCGVGPLTGGFGWLLLLVLIPVWLYYLSSGADKLRCTRCGEVLREDVGTLRTAIAAKQQKAEREAQALEESRVRAIDARRVNPELLCQQLAKTRILVKTGVISNEEAQEERRRLIAIAAEDGWTDQAIVDFLGPAGALLQQGAIEADDAKVLKAIHASVAKGRPMAERPAAEPPASKHITPTAEPVDRSASTASPAVRKAPTPAAGGNAVTFLSLLLLGTALSAFGFGMIVFIVSIALGLI